MKATKFKEGDIVRIRQWDDMEAEFGICKDGNIDCLCLFVTEMKPLCGLRAKIRTMDNVSYERKGKSTVYLDFLDSAPHSVPHIEWSYSTDMIELAENEEVIDVEPEELQPVIPEKEDISDLLEELGGLF